MHCCSITFARLGLTTSGPSRCFFLTFVALLPVAHAHRVSPGGALWGEAGDEPLPQPRPANAKINDGISSTRHVNLTKVTSGNSTFFVPEALLQASGLMGEPGGAYIRPLMQDEEGKKFVYSSRFARAKYGNFHMVKERYLDFLNYLRSNEAAGQSMIFALVVAVVGPFVLYGCALCLISQLRPIFQESFPLMHEDVEKLVSNFSLTISVAGALQIAVRCILFEGEIRWIQVEIEQKLTNLIYFLIGWSISRFCGIVDKVIKIGLKNAVDDDYQWRHEFMATISSPTNVEPLPPACKTLEETLLRLVWMPFYITTQVVVWSMTILTLFGWELSWYIVGSMYFFMGLLSAVFGARTLGPDLYGGVVILLEKPFEIGDIISVEWKGGPGGCTDTLATGFVEKMSLRSTTIRRFDMRSCTVPNSWFTKYQVSNWKRPRKLINLDVGISHSTPLEAVKRFQQEAKQIVKNHPDIDQQLYTKAVFNKLSNGFIFRVVCFNAVATKKQIVQQDLLYRFSGLARQLGIVITFGEQSLNIQKMEMSSHYLPQNEISADIDLSDIVPKRSDEALSQPKTAPEGYILVRIEEASGIERLVPQEAGYIFVRVSYESFSNSEQHHTTALQMVCGDMMNVKWFQTLALNCRKRFSVNSYAKIELCSVGKQVMQQYFRKAQVLAHAIVDLASYGDQNLEASWIVLNPGESISERCSDVRVSIRVFVAPNIQFSVRRKTGSATSYTDSQSVASSRKTPSIRRGRLSGVGKFTESLHRELARPASLQLDQQLCSQAPASPKAGSDLLRREMSRAARGSDIDTDSEGNTECN